MRQTHPEGMDEGPRRLGRSERLIMGDFDRHGLSFAVERSIANSYRLVVLRSLGAAGIPTKPQKLPGRAHIGLTPPKMGRRLCTKGRVEHFSSNFRSGEES